MAMMAIDIKSGPKKLRHLFASRKAVAQSGEREASAAQLIERADKARDEKNFLDAAKLYEAALALEPTNAAIHVQCGHMNKEAGYYQAAERHYSAAWNLTPDDPDLHLQIGHFYKVCGRWSEAIVLYESAGGKGLPSPDDLSFVRRKHAIHLIDTLLADTFDSDRYLELNPDVKAADMRPLDHFIQYGAREGRGKDPRVGSIEMTKEVWDKGVRGRSNGD